MLEPIEGMPPGTLGWRTGGKMEATDYTEVFVPAAREKIDAGEDLRMVFVISKDFGETGSALWQDIKAEVELGIGHWKSWKRIAVVTDIEWLRKAFGAFAWMVPGEAKYFAEADLEAAKTWVAG
jgi:hypothetical protein